MSIDLILRKKDTPEESHKEKRRTPEVEELEFIVIVELQRERVDISRGLKVDTVEEKKNSTPGPLEGWNYEVDHICWLLDRKESLILVPVMFPGSGFEGIGDNYSCKLLRAKMLSAIGSQGCMETGSKLHLFIIRHFVSIVC
jgi:hypothetical protein